MTDSTTTVDAPPGRIVLDELRELLDRHADVDDLDVAELLDEVGRIVRRGRAAVRRAAPKPEPTAKPEPDGGEPVGKPATPAVAPQPPSVVSPAAATPNREVSTPAAPPAGRPSRDAGSDASPRDPHDASSGWRGVVAWAGGWRNLLAFGLTVLVAAAFAVVGFGVVPTLAAAAVVVLAAVVAVLVRRPGRGGTARRFWPSGWS